MEGKAIYRQVFLRTVREVEMSRDWFRSVFVVNLNISKVFAETITQSAIGGIVSKETVCCVGGKVKH